MARKKVTAAPVLKDWAAADETMKELAHTQAKLQQLEAERERALQSVREKHAKGIDPLLSQVVRMEKDLQEFAEFHFEEFTGTAGKRTRQLNYGQLGFRKSPGKLKTQKGWTWEKVLAKLKDLRMWRYIRKKEEADKQGIKDAYAAGKIDDERLAAMGLQMHAPDEFWYEVTRTPMVAVVSEDAAQAA